MEKTLKDYQKEADRKGQEAAEMLSRALNTMTYEKETIEGFVRGITNQHRSLQQGCMRAIYALIMEWASQQERGYFDLRNEETVKFCKAIKDCILPGNRNFPLI